ncbi:unnamed protein product [marine sediment metagenome]|uniref:Uncharacterized protein n=1 Tax=marine sediment metagenome TaxID=412755 RepID=X0SUF0_9ZZZZ
MLTTRNEFETIPAFEVITGSSYGGFTPREIAVDLIYAIEKVTNLIDTKQDWQYLATYSDNELTEIDELISEYIQHLNYYAPIPDSCSIDWHDNELIVMPYIDDEIERFEDCPDDFSDDVIYVVNDHGNVTCYRWNPNDVSGNQTGAYNAIWDMV